MNSRLMAATLRWRRFGGAAAHAQAFINVLTGGTSGVYYPLGVAIGKSTATNSEREDPGAGHQGVG